MYPYYNYPLSLIIISVSGFWNTLSSLRTRLDGCVTSLSDIQVLLADADSKLRACEFWLLEHGKFSDNQFILEQKGSYEVRGVVNNCFGVFMSCCL